MCVGSENALERMILVICWNWEGTDLDISCAKKATDNGALSRAGFEVHQNMTIFFSVGKIVCAFPKRLHL